MRRNDDWKAPLGCLLLVCCAIVYAVHNDREKEIERARAEFPRDGWIAGIGGDRTEDGIRIDDSYKGNRRLRIDDFVAITFGDNWTNKIEYTIKWSINNTGGKPRIDWRNVKLITQLTPVECGDTMRPPCWEAHTVTNLVTTPMGLDRFKTTCVFDKQENGVRRDFWLMTEVEMTEVEE